MSKEVMLLHNNDYTELLNNMRKTTKNLLYVNKVFFAIKYTYNSLQILEKDLNLDSVKLEDYILYFLGMKDINEKGGNIKPFIESYWCHIYTISDLCDYNKYYENATNYRVKVTCLDLLNSIILNPQIMFDCLSDFDKAYAKTLVSIYINFVVKIIPIIEKIQNIDYLGYVLNSKHIEWNYSFSKTIEIIEQIIIDTLKEETKQC